MSYLVSPNRSRNGGKFIYLPKKLVIPSKRPSLILKSEGGGGGGGAVKEDIIPAPLYKKRRRGRGEKPASLRQDFQKPTIKETIT